jgi:hypothetical protein
MARNLRPLRRYRFNSGLKPTTNDNSKAVYIFNKELVLIESFTSIKAFSEKWGFSYNEITTACKNKTMLYKWFVSFENQFDPTPLPTPKNFI